MLLCYERDINSILAILKYCILSISKVDASLFVPFKRSVIDETSPFNWQIVLCVHYIIMHNARKGPLCLIRIVMTQISLHVQAVLSSHSLFVDIFYNNPLTL